MRHLSRRSVVLLAAAIGGLLGVGGCPAPVNNNSGSNKATALKPFASGDELVRYVRERVGASSRRQGLFRNFGLAPTSAAEGAADSNTAGGADDGSFSTTNIQEAGVDESDVFKSDGTHFYLAKENSLRIVRATPVSGLAEVGRLDLPENIESLYLFDGRVIVLGQSFGRPGEPGIAMIDIWPPYYAGGNTVVYDVDVSDPAAPKIARKSEMDGTLIASRLTGGRLILVMNIVPRVPSNLGALTPLSAADVLPRVRAAGREAAAMNASSIYYPDAPNGWYMTSITTLDAANVESVLGATAVMANAGTVYVSPNALYLSDTDYDEADNFRETTSVHKFTFDEGGVAKYVASGSVSGRLLNQFSLGEHEGVLRLATHVQPALPVGPFIGFGGGDVAVSNGGAAETAPRPATAQARNESSVASNAVWTLGEADGQLKQLGSITGIAPDERIYSARFLGDTGFLVTFRQIDPLFTIDLSDPANPQLIGELKVPGFSDYLHPVGEKLLIGVGRSVTLTPWGGAVPTSVQLSLFDVSDLKNPVAIQQLELGGYGSGSEVNFNHKAFTFLPSTGVLALPVTLTNDDYKASFAFDARYVEPEYRTGVIAFRVTEKGFERLGFLDDSGRRGADNWWWPQWRRAAIIGESLYVASPLRVSGAPLADLTAATRVDLTPNPQDEVARDVGIIPLDVRR
ncbi:MAG: beta-propeller domain-containing protein [Phycisphaerales bacterium]|nr:beta-propeller domain-containing protein [Phycisphaerales bacterium]